MPRVSRDAYRRSLLVLVPLLVGARIGFAQGTDFTYQGRLTEGSTAANGTYDLQFRLFDSPTGGTQQPQPSPVTLQRTGVPVANGIFTVPLDFGALAFPGADRYLEIAVRHDSSESYVMLTPRQKVSPTPYAFRSSSAALADAATNAANASQLNGQSAGFYTNASSLSAGTVAEARLPATVARSNAGNVFQPTTDVTGLTVQRATGSSVSDIFSVRNTTGAAKHLWVESTGTVKWAGIAQGNATGNFFGTFSGVGMNLATGFAGTTHSRGCTDAGASCGDCLDQSGNNTCWISNAPPYPSTSWMLLATADVHEIGTLAVRLGGNAVACTSREPMDPIVLELRMQLRQSTPEPMDWPESLGPSLHLGTGTARVPGGNFGAGYLLNDRVSGEILVDGFAVPFGEYHVFVRATPGTSYSPGCYLQQPPSGDPANVFVHFSPTLLVAVDP